MHCMPGRCSFEHGNFNLGNLQLVPKFSQARQLKKGQVKDLEALIPYINPPSKRQWLETIVACQKNLLAASGGHDNDPHEDHDDDPNDPDE